MSSELSKIISIDEDEDIIIQNGVRYINYNGTYIPIIEEDDLENNSTEH